MKLIRILLIAFAAMLSVGMLSCNKDEVIPDTGDNDSGNQEEESSVEWVDLGLPSGLLWAKCNLGATAPEEYGDNYSWGETAKKEIYDWSTYRYCTADGDSLQTLTKYNTSENYGTIDNLTTLQAMDDAAMSALAGDARIPTREEWEELLNHTTAEWTVQNGVGGYKLTATNGKSLFLPAAGSSNGSELVAAGVYGFYWSASLYTDSPDDAWSFSFYSEDHLIGSFGYRADGQSVRPVRSTSNPK